MELMFWQVVRLSRLMSAQPVIITTQVVDLSILMRMTWRFIPPNLNL